MAGKKDDSWMDKVKGGPRESAYSAPKREKVRKERGNIAEVIREKQRRDWESGGGYTP